MFETLAQWVAKVFAPTTYQSNLEAYLESKNPQSPGDIEHWLKRYDDERRENSRFIANGY
jgi:hypothetical protein